MACCFFVVSGIVQGVGFRAFVESQAQGLGLNGWVQNDPDGTVRVFACGSEKTLQDLEEALAKGPRGARVLLVERRVTHEVSQGDGFSVRF